MRKFIILLWLFVIGIACQPREAEFPDDYVNPDLLVEAGWLAGNLDMEGLVIVDMREERGDEYIPGAVDFGGVPALIDPDHEVDNFLIGADAFGELMSESGISNSSKVVIYDEGPSIRSTRLFHALEYYGHTDTHVLNGGLAAWKAGGHPLAEDPAEPIPQTFTVNINEAAVCDIGAVLAAIDDDNTIILDARPADHYSGETVIAERGGHVPGAVNIFWREMISEDDVPRFKTAKEIAGIHAEHGISPDKRVITHCHSNMQASNAYFVLRLMGYQDITSYEGSWSEYGNRDDVPVVN